MNKERTVRNEKVDISFIKRVEDIATKRIENRLDHISRPLSIRRATLAIARHNPTWDVLANAELLEDKQKRLGKKGQFEIFMLFKFMIVAFLAVVLFAGLIWVSGLLNNTFHQVGITNEANAGQPGYVNMTKASDDTFGQMNSSIQALRLVAICMIFAEILGTVVVASFGRKHPALFIAYIFIVVLAVIFSATISNAYETLLQAGIYDGTLSSFTGANWILLNLPAVVSVLGVISATFLFVNIIRTGSEGSL